MASCTGDLRMRQDRLLIAVSQRPRHPMDIEDSLAMPRVILPQ